MELEERAAETRPSRGPIQRVRRVYEHIVDRLHFEFPEHPVLAGERGQDTGLLLKAEVEEAQVMVDEDELAAELRKGRQEALSHPSPTLLERYGLFPHRLEEGELAAIKTHLADCERCAKQLSSMHQHERYLRSLINHKPCD